MAAAPPMLPVVGQQFCEPHAVDLTVTRSVATGFLKDDGGGFTATDAAGAVVLATEPRFIYREKGRRVLVDADGMPLLSMRRKAYSLQYTWEVFRGSSTNANRLLFTVRRSSLLPQLKLEINVFLAGNTMQNACDFRIKCSFFSRSCILYIGNSNTPIAQINRKFSGLSDMIFVGSKFSVTVFPHVDYVFVMALVVILDEIARDIRRGAVIQISTSQRPGRSTR
ncbi:protein LURP-one-related 10-like [Oryza glaberrima]|uniref:protein LURP-one-related 10-like n=1 Tax=Oryza glaberrima TaxID=4538 RepID=UPI00224C20A7|nr:protein LURP-one-related 10-like [Oryza glaberrima]